MFLKFTIIYTILTAVNCRNPLFYSGGLRANYTQPYVDSCYLRHCTTNEHCCSRSVCLILLESSGYCFYYRGLNLGQMCKADRDCDYNLICRRSDHFEFGKCRESDHEKLHYGEVCNTTMDCNFRNGLCCMIQKRPRQKPRNICAYYSDPLRCIDIVPVDSVRKNAKSLTIAEQIIVEDELKDII